MNIDPVGVPVFYPSLFNPVSPTTSSDSAELDEAMAKFIECADLEQREQPFSSHSLHERTKLLPVWKTNRKQIKASFMATLDLVEKSSSPTPYILKLIEIISARYLFKCTSVREAIRLLTSLVRDRQIVKDAAYQVLCVGPNSSVGAARLENMLWCGIYFDDEALVREAISGGVDVNCILYANITPILLACSKGSENIARMLIEQGAKVQVAGGTHHHKTPLSEVMLFNRFSEGFVQELTYLDAGFTPAFEAIKNISHRFSVSTPDGSVMLKGHAIRLWGSRTRCSIKDYLRTAQPYYESLKERLYENPEEAFKGVYEHLSEETRVQLQNPEVRAGLCAALDRTLAAMEWSLLREKQFHQAEGRIADVSRAHLQEMMEKLDRGEPVICFDITRMHLGHTELHAWGLVVFKQKDETFNVSYCDRTGSFTGISTKNVSREDLIRLLKGYLKAINWKVDFSGKTGAKFYRYVGGLFRFTDKFRVITNPNFIPQKKQRTGIGNCCYYSAQSIELATLTGLFEGILGKGPDVILLAKKTKQLRTSAMRIEGLRHFIDLGGPSQSAASSSTSSAEDVFTHQKEWLLSEIYYEAMDNPKLSGVRDAFAPYASHYDKILNDKALRSAWTKIVPILFAADNSLDSTEMSKYSPDAIREFLHSHREIVQKVTTIEISCLNLKVFPMELLNFTGLRSLSITSAKLKQLPALDFPHLVRLVISGNSIQQLPAMKLPKLIYLFAQRNAFSRLPDLSGMPDLIHVDFEFNSISELAGLPPTLRLLNLSANRLSDFTTSELGRLVHLDLSMNPLGRIPEINAPKLESLYVEEIGLKEVTEVDQNRLNSLTNLTKLFIARNSLTCKQELNLPNCEISVLAPFR